MSIERITITPPPEIGKGEDRDEVVTPPPTQLAGDALSPMRGVGHSLLERGAGIKFGSPERGKRLVELLSDGEDEIPPCFAGLREVRQGAREKLHRALSQEGIDPPRPLRARSPREELTASPDLDRLRQLGKRAAEGILGKSSHTFFSNLVSQWILEDHPTQHCLTFLCLDDRASIQDFVAHYTDLRAQRDATLATLMEEARERLDATYGPFFTQLIHRHAFSLLQAHRSQDIPLALKNLLRDNTTWDKIIGAIPTILSPITDKLNLPKDPSDPSLPHIIEEIKSEISGGDTDAHKLLQLLLDPKQPILFVKLMRNTTPQIRLSSLVLKTLTAHFTTHETVMDRLSVAFDGIDTSPLIASITQSVHSDMRLSPSLQTLLDEHLKHTYERFRLLPRLYSLYANTLARIASHTPLTQQNALREAFAEIARLSADRECASERYRHTQAHAAVPRETKLKMKWHAQGLYIETGEKPPEGAHLAEGSHTLPNPGAFSPNPRNIARILESHTFSPCYSPDGALWVDHATHDHDALKKLIDAYKERKLDQEILMSHFASAIDALYEQDPNHFVWKAYWLITEVFLHAFSETQYFPDFVNHQIDSWSENKELLASALTVLISDALTPGRDAPLTREDANRALAPLYRESLELCEKNTREFYALYNETQRLFPLIKAWMGFHVASTIPRPAPLAAKREEERGDFP